MNFAADIKAQDLGVARVWRKKILISWESNIDSIKSKINLGYMRAKYGLKRDNYGLHLEDLPNFST